MTGPAALITQIDRHRQLAQPVTVLGLFGMERDIWRIRLPDGRVTVADGSMLRRAA